MSLNLTQSQKLAKTKADIIREEISWLDCLKGKFYAYQKLEIERKRSAFRPKIELVRNAFQSYFAESVKCLTERTKLSFEDVAARLLITPATLKNYCDPDYSIKNGGIMSVRVKDLETLLKYQRNLKNAALARQFLKITGKKVTAKEAVNEYNKLFE